MKRIVIVSLAVLLAIGVAGCYPSKYYKECSPCYVNVPERY